MFLLSNKTVRKTNFVIRVFLGGIKGINKNTFKQGRIMGFNFSYNH